MSARYSAVTSSAVNAVLSRHRDEYEYEYELQDFSQSHG